VNPGATRRTDAGTVYFCSDHCAERYDRDPGRYAGGPQHQVTEQPGRSAEPHGVLDPVCGMTVDPDTAAEQVEHDGQVYSFCGAGCAATFRADPVAVLSGDRAHSAHGHH
jgi:YHS domain-containing protein